MHLFTNYLLSSDHVPGIMLRKEEGPGSHGADSLQEETLQSNIHTKVTVLLGRKVHGAGSQYRVKNHLFRSSQEPSLYKQSV